MRRERDARGVVRQVLELLLLWPQGGKGVGDGWRVEGGIRQGEGLVVRGGKKPKKKMTGKLLKKENMMASSKKLLVEAGRRAERWNEGRRIKVERMVKGL